MQKCNIFLIQMLKLLKENCEFQYYYNKTDVKPSVLDGGNEIILAIGPKQNM